MGTLLLAITAIGVHAGAQTTAAPYTMHVFANLVQIPVLVLSDDLRPIGPVAPSEFRIRLGTNKPFAPASVRREGEDPISLSVLIDVSGDQDDLLPSFAAAFGDMAKSLQPHDRVSLYAVDCQLVRAAVDMPPDHDALKLAAERALASPLTHDAKSPHGCSTFLPLWNAVTRMITDLSTQPGRRVVLAITDGLDGGSILTAAEVRDRANSAGVALFGISVTGNDVREQLYRESGSRNVFAPVCETTGGIVFTPNSNELAATTKTFVSMLRDRYIMEFARPPHLVRGRQNIEVTLKKTHAFIRSSGISVPIADPVLPPTQKELGPVAPPAATPLVPVDPVPSPE